MNIEKQLEKAKQEVSRIEAQIAEIKLLTRWPKKGQDMSILYVDGDIAPLMYDDIDIANNILKQGNGFRTVQEATIERDRREAKTTYLKGINTLNMKRNWVCDWDDEDQVKCNLGFYHDTQMLTSKTSCSEQLLPSDEYFHRDDLDTVRKTLASYFKIMMGVK